MGSGRYTNLMGGADPLFSLQSDPMVRESAPTVEDARRAASALPGSILLFGSVARGDSRPASDIDLMVVVDDVDDDQQRWRAFDLGKVASADCGRRVQILGRGVVPTFGCPPTSAGNRNTFGADVWRPSLAFPLDIGEGVHHFPVVSGDGPHLPFHLSAGHPVISRFGHRIVLRVGGGQTQQSPGGDHPSPRGCFYGEVAVDRLYGL